MHSLKTSNKHVIVWVNNAKIFAIFAVVILHVSADVVSSADTINNRQWWIGNIYDSVVRWCVPVFVMLSGVLLLKNEKTESVYLFYKKRAGRILLPTLFWSLFFLVWTYMKGVGNESVKSIMSLGKSLFLGSPYYHMWYLYMLIGLYIATPFVRIFVKNASIHELTFLIVILFSITAANSLYGSLYDVKKGLFIIWFLNYLPYFICGYLIGFFDARLTKSFLVLLFILSVLATATGCHFVSQYHGLKRGLYFYNYLSITVIPMSIAIILLFKRTTNPIINAYDHWRRRRRPGGRGRAVYNTPQKLDRAIRCM